MQSLSPRYGRRARSWSAILSAGLLLLAAHAWAGQSVYVVKRGDTLSGIARQHNLSTAALAERNGLNRNHHVKTGQRLIIPNVAVAAGSTATTQTTAYTVKRGDTLSALAKASNVSLATLANLNGVSTRYELKIGEKIKLPAPASSAAGSPAPSGTLPRTVASAISSASVQPGRWKYIVIHHSGVSEGTVKGMDNYHRQVRHMENGLAYHFVIGNGNGMGNGEVAVGNRWTRQLDGGHLASVEQNKVAIGICLVGNFDKTVPTSAEMRSLTALVKALMARCNISAANVKTHQQINVIGTRCPGSKFPTKSFLAGLK